MNGISQLLDNDSEITHIDKEAKLVKGKLLLGGQDIVAKFDQRMVVAPHHLLHLGQGGSTVKKAMNKNTGHKQRTEVALAFAPKLSS